MYVQGAGKLIRSNELLTPVSTNLHYCTVLDVWCLHADAKFAGKRCNRRVAVWLPLVPRFSPRLERTPSPKRGHVGAPR